MTLGYGEEHGGEITVRGPQGWDALLMSRLDFDVRVLEVPPVSDRDVESLLRLKLRSLYPASPQETAFDFRLVRRGARRQAIVFVSRRRTVDAYRRAAGRKPLLLPYQLLVPRVPGKGDWRAWICHHDWAELLVYRDGALLSSTARRLAFERQDGTDTATGFDLAAEEGRLPEAVRAGALLVAAPQDLDLAGRVNGAAFVSLEKLCGTGKRTDGLFPPHRRKRFLSRRARIALLTAAVLILGLLVFYKYVRQVEDYSSRLTARAASLEKGNQEALAAQRDLETLRAEKVRLDAKAPRDLYRLLSELSIVLGDAARIQGLTVRDDAFQLDAVGTNPLALMEGLKTRADFSDLRLSQVVPDPTTGKERFSISGVFHGR